MAPEFDQLTAEGRVEEQVARELRHRRIRSQAAQQIAHHGGHAADEILRELAHEVGWPDPQHVDFAERIVRAARPTMQHARVHPFAVLDVDLDGVEHDGVEEHPRDLCHGGRLTRAGRCRVRRWSADTDRDDAVRAEVDGGAERRRVADRAIPEVPARDLDRGEEDRDGARGEEVLDANGGALDAPAATRPPGSVWRRGEEDHAVGGVEIGGDECQRRDTSLRHVGLDA